MTSTQMKKNILVGFLVVAVVLFGVYQYNPRLIKQFTEGFKTENDVSAPGVPPATATASTTDKQVKAMPEQAMPSEKKEMPTQAEKKEAFADLNQYQGEANFAPVDAPAGCYPRDQLTPSELLPKDMNSIWAEQNPMGPGSLKGKNFLSAGALIGVNTVGQSLRNANLQVRSEPPNPQVAVSIFNQSTISPDISHRPLEIGS
jgi:hypothetical protein